MTQPGLLSLIDKDWQVIQKCFHQFLSDINLDEKSKYSLSSLTKPLLYKVDNMDCS